MERVELREFTSVVKDITSGNKKFKTKNYLEEGEYPIIDQGGKIIAGYTNENEIVKRNKDIVIFGDHTRKLKYIDFDFCLGADGTKVLEPTDKLDSKFLFYYLKTKTLPDVGYSRHYKFLKRIKIPLPDLPTQKAIAARLDQAEAVKNYNQALLAKYDQLGQAIFLEMFGDPVKNEKGWEVERLEDVSSKITDGTHDTPKRLKEGIEFITGKHIKPFKIDFKNSDFVTEKVHKKIYSRCNPEFEDILYTNIGANTATAAMNPVEHQFSMKNVALIKYNRNIFKGRYLEYLLNDKSFKNKLMSKFGIGGAQKFMSLKKIKSIKVYIPPLDLQTAFARRIENIEHQKAFLRQEIEKSEELFNSLLQASFRVEEEAGANTL